MRHGFLVALFLCITGNTAQAQSALAASGSQQSPEVFVVEDDGKGALLVFLGGVKVARCATVNQKFDCEAVSLKAEIVPAHKMEPNSESAPALDGAP